MNFFEYLKSKFWIHWFHIYEIVGLDVEGKYIKECIVCHKQQVLRNFNGHNIWHTIQERGEDKK